MITHPRSLIGAARARVERLLGPYGPYMAEPEEAEYLTALADALADTLDALDAIADTERSRASASDLRKIVRDTLDRMEKP